MANFKISIRIKVFISILIMLISSLSFAQVKPPELSKTVKERLERVPEFKFIQEEADKLGVKVYLFGGTASAFAHYVRWDIERESGDDKYQEERFDYDFTNIYRGNQDLDIVVDGTAEQANQLESVLKEKYPHFVGSKDAWEVRLLRKSKGDKLPLLNDFDFLNQHTDTNSTGMVAINPSGSDFVFRDLFSWKTKSSRFLNDVAGARIKFLYSDTHEDTSRYKEGKNPSIFAAVRYLAKLTQYEVQGDPEDLKTIKKIVEEADWAEVKNNPYIRHKLEEFGKKVLLNAPDSEYAWDLLEKIGLRKKLMEMDGNKIDSQGSLSWWMNKAPLRSSPLGKKGKTAKELFGNEEIIVTHETNSFVAYENITRSSKGLANAFISRVGASGESAAFGNGFYTKVGRNGAAGTNLSIRFKLKPNAREDIDFVKCGEYVIVKNKNALTLIQENLDLSLVNYLKLLMSGDIGTSDKGLTEKFNRKFSRVDTNSKEFKEAVEFASESIFIADDFPKGPGYESFNKTELNTFDELMDFFMNERLEFYKDLLHKDMKGDIDFEGHPNWVKTLIEKSPLGEEIAEQILSKEHWAQYPELVEILIAKNGDADWAIAEYVLSKKYWAKYPYLLEKLIENGEKNADWAIAQHVLGKGYWAEHSGVAKAAVEEIIERSGDDSFIIKYVLSKDYWQKDFGWLKKVTKNLIEKNDANLDVLLVNFLFSNEYWTDHPDLLEKLIENGNISEYIVEGILPHPGWTKHPHLVEKLIEEGSLNEEIIEHILTEEHWAEHPYLVEKIIIAGDVDEKIVEYVLLGEHWLDHPKGPYLIEKLIENGSVDAKIAEQILSNSSWADHPKGPYLVEKIIENGRDNFHVVEHVLSYPDWVKHPHLVEKIIEEDDQDVMVAKKILSYPGWEKHPHLVEMLIEKDEADYEVAESVLSEPHWAKYPHLVERLIEKGDESTLEVIMFRTLSESHWSKYPHLLVMLIEKGDVDTPDIDNLLEYKHWRNHKELKAYLKGKKITAANIEKRLDKISFSDWKTQKASSAKKLYCNQVL